MQQTEKFDVFYFVICMWTISLKEENSRAQKEKVESAGEKERKGGTGTGTRT